jgi:succinate dehydrogenase / fumarate reductase membrane anchor subunit
VGWKTFDWVMLVLAVLHGTNGLRVVIDDYIRRPGTRIAIKGFLYMLAAVLTVMGTAVIVTFSPRAI